MHWKNALVKYTRNPGIFLEKSLKIIIDYEL